MTTQNQQLTAGPVRTTPFPPLPPRFDGKELQNLQAALQSNSLFYTQPDGFVSRMVKRAAEELGAAHAVATSSGTASLHVAIGAAGIRAGAEVITAPITDMGTCIAILYQNAIPVFADVDPLTYNITAETIEAVITQRTQAVVVVHLTGSPCDMEPIVELCKRHKLILIEDSAQAWGAKYRGRHVGNFGAIGCFSFNNFKHLSCGDGGVVITQEEKLFYACHNFADKYYDRMNQGVRLSQLAPNYRMTELQGAVALAQFDKMKSIVDRRRMLGDRLTAAISNIKGVLPPRKAAGAESSYWFYMFRVDERALGINRDEFAVRLGAEGVPAGKGYIQRPICKEPVFLEKNFFAGGVWPAELIAGRKYDYQSLSVPNAQLVLDTAITLALHEGFSESDVDDYARAIRKVAELA